MTIKNISIITIQKNKFFVKNDNGELFEYDQTQVQNFVLNTKSLLLICHKNNVLKKIGLEHIDNEKVLDILELWAFVRPCQFVVPTVDEIAKTLKIDSKNQIEILSEATKILLSEIKSEIGRPYLPKLIASMTKTGWAWGKFLLEELETSISNFSGDIIDGFDIWNRVKKWESRPPPPPPANNQVTEDEVTQQLKSLLPENQEQRLEQFKYSKSLIDSFNSKDTEEPVITLAEGGTGVGKTIGYLAPATVWAKKNDAPIWISTYTRNLQHQIYDEVKRLYKNDKELYDRVVICKGRENYICITKFKIAVRKSRQEKGWTIALGILARWLEKTTDGDINGNDFPSWLSEIIDPQNRILKLLSVRRDYGETHSHCEHSDSCFVDLNIKRSAYADIVITNHAFLLFNAKVGFVGEQAISRIVFDEGHHLFEASDSAFGSFLSAVEGEFMRRFIIKNENGDMLGGSGTGLKSIITEIFGSDGNIQKYLDDILNNASVLPDSNWRERLDSGNPKGVGEEFFNELTKFILNNTNPTNYDVELDNSYIPNNIIELGLKYANHLNAMVNPIKKIINVCEEKLSTQYAELDKEQRRKITNAFKILSFRILDPIIVWVDMLNSLSPEYTSEYFDRENIIDTLTLTKVAGNHHDVGIKRHYINPIKEFAKCIYPQINGAVITSATLLDSTDDEDKNWNWATVRTGTNNQEKSPNQVQVKSPFDYKNKSRIIVVNDIEKNNINQLSSGIYQLFNANGGAGLALFNSIARLKNVHEKINKEIAETGINLYAQHIDNINTPTLINLFKHDFYSCLLGTNAVRDGVDIPGGSLSLLVMERIPWETPSVIHKQRRNHFKNEYDKSLARIKLKQAFGRLIRNKNDYGTFVLLDSLPSDLKTAFPDTCEIITCGISEAIQIIKNN